MQYLTITRRRIETISDAEFAARRAEEIARAQALYAEGFIRQIWHRDDIGGACMVVEAASEDEVRHKLNTLPFAQAGMLEISIIPLKPYGGFCPS
jgi:muconolactone delta-isomerase